MNLSEDQRKVFDLYLEKENVFVTGPGGSGKSYLIKEIYNHSKNNEKKIQVCALTGCAAFSLNCSAKTLHSWAGIGLGTESVEELSNKIRKNKYKFKNWRSTDILIVDEVSIMSKNLLELLNNIAKIIKKKDLPFGGMQVIFSGDFYQLPPIDKTKKDVSFCFESKTWSELFQRQIKLKSIFRQTDESYINILNQVREGNLSEENEKILKGKINRKVPEGSEIIPTFLCPIKSAVEEINKQKIKKLTSEVYSYEVNKRCDLSMNNGEKILRQNYNQINIDVELEFIANNISCDKKIDLKIGAQVMCTINIKDENVLFISNGSQGIVSGISKNNYPIVRYFNGHIREMGPNLWKSENIPGIGIEQIPLILSWALTIHKAQGATLEMAEIDVGSNVFEFGQTYVALSRVVSIDGLYLKSFDKNKIKVNSKVKLFYDNLK